MTDTDALPQTERHPTYGPCDTLGPKGECSECALATFHDRAAWLAWLRQPRHCPEPIRTIPMPGLVPPRMGLRRMDENWPRPGGRKGRGGYARIRNRPGT